MYRQFKFANNSSLVESFIGAVIIKVFQFEYKGITVDTKINYEIWYKSEEFEDKFELRRETGVILKSFDSLLEAKTYLYQYIKDLKEKLDKEQEEIKEHIEKKKRRRRKKGD